MNSSKDPWPTCSRCGKVFLTVSLHATKGSLDNVIPNCGQCRKIISEPKPRLSGLQQSVWTGRASSESVPEEIQVSELDSPDCFKDRLTAVNFEVFQSAPDWAKSTTTSQDEEKSVSSMKENHAHISGEKGQHNYEQQEEDGESQYTEKSNEFVAELTRNGSQMRNESAVKAMDAGIPCIVCKKQFSCRKSLQEHLFAKHRFSRVLPDKFVCLLCKKQIILQGLVDHLTSCYKALTLSKITIDEGIELECFKCKQNIIPQLYPSHVQKCFAFHCFLACNKNYDKKCNTCNAAFTSDRLLRVHLDTHKTKEQMLEDNDRTSMEFIVKYATTRRNVAKYLSPQIKSTRRVSCLFCSEIFVDMDTLDSHMQEHTEEYLEYCSFCNMEFFDNDELDKHLDAGLCSQNDTETLGLFNLGPHDRYFPQCRRCFKSFWVNSALAKHINDKKCKPLDKTKPRCTTCRQYFSGIGDLKKHLRKMRCKKKDYYARKTRPLCETCQCYFPGFRDLNRHKKTCNSQETKKAQKSECESCLIIFPSKIHLQRHLNHEPEKKGLICTGIGRPDKGIPCQFCNKRFVKKILNRHLKTCPIKNSRKCQICSKKFSTSQGYRKHIEKGTCLNQCGICKKVFHTPTLLKLHQLNHNDMQYRCRFCDAQSRNIGSLRIHLQCCRKFRFSFECPVCNSVESTDINHALEHVATCNTVTNDKVVKCSFCKFEILTTIYKLHYHKELLKSRLCKSYKLKCSKCECKLPTEKLKKLHEALHKKGDQSALKESQFDASPNSTIRQKPWAQLSHTENLQRQSSVTTKKTIVSNTNESNDHIPIGQGQHSSQQQEDYQNDEMADSFITTSNSSGTNVSQTRRKPDPKCRDAGIHCVKESHLDASPTALLTICDETWAQLRNPEILQTQSSVNNDKTIVTNNYENHHQPSSEQQQQGEDEDYETNDDTINSMNSTHRNNSHRKIYAQQSENYANKKWQCDTCLVYFPSKIHLKSHQSGKAGLACRKRGRPTTKHQTPCRYCNRLFATGMFREKHEKTCKLIHNYTCKDCNKRFTRYKIYQKHVENKNCVNECRVCKKTFPNPSKLKVHEQNHGERLYSCIHCHVSYYEKRHIRRHLLNCTKFIFSFECPICNDVQSTDISYALEHVATCNTVTNDKMVKCSFCKLDIQTGIYKLHYHKELLKSQLGERFKLKCTFCECKLPTEKLKNLHENLHEYVAESTVEETGLFPCNKCTYNCKSWKELYHHMKKEHGDVLSANIIEYANKAEKRELNVPFCKANNTPADYYRCFVCFKPYSSRMALKLHSLRCRKEKETMNLGKKIIYNGEPLKELRVLLRRVQLPSNNIN